jgi:hypothetical protein
MRTSMTAHIVNLPSEKQIAELALKSAAAWQVAEKAVAAAEKIDAELAAMPASSPIGVRAKLVVEMARRARDQAR